MTAEAAAYEFTKHLGVRPLPVKDSQRPSLIDRLVLESATPRTRRLLTEFEAQHQVRVDLLSVILVRISSQQ